MAIELPTITIAELHKQLQAYIDQGLGDVPVVATDGSGRYPFQAYTVLNASGYTDAFLLYGRPDAHFAQRDPLPPNSVPSRVAKWNAGADRVKSACGAFIRACVSAMLLAAFLAGCASPYQSLPVRTGVVTETQQSLRKVFQPSAGGAAAGAAVGGIVGNQIGKGNGRKVATALGVLGGAVVGAGAAGTEKMVPYTLVSFRDNETGKMYEAAIDGPWRPGMAIRYSITEDGKLVLR